MKHHLHPHQWHITTFDPGRSSERVPRNVFRRSIYPLDVCVPLQYCVRRTSPDLIDLEDGVAPNIASGVSDRHYSFNHVYEKTGHWCFGQVLLQGTEGHG
jgi:hypothetical protein